MLVGHNLMEILNLIVKLKVRLLFPIYRDWGSGRVERGNYQGAVQDCTKAITLKPDAPEPYMHRGTAYFRLGDTDAAAADYDRALELAPDYVTAHINRGNLHQSLGNHQEAIRSYNLAIHHDPHNAAAYYNRGLIAVQLEQYANALADYTQALRLKPGYGFIYGNRGEVYFMMGRYKDALADFRQAHHMLPRMRRAVAGMAIAWHALGQSLEASRLWNHLLERDMGYNDADWVQVEHAWNATLTNEVRGLLLDLDTETHQ